MYKYQEVGGGRFVLSVDNHVEIVEALGALRAE